MHPYFLKYIGHGKALQCGSKAVLCTGKTLQILSHERCVGKISRYGSLKEVSEGSDIPIIYSQLWMVREKGIFVKKVQKVRLKRLKMCQITSGLKGVFWRLGGWSLNVPGRFRQRFARSTQWWPKFTTSQADGPKNVIGNVFGKILLFWSIFSFFWATLRWTAVVSISWMLIAKSWAKK